MINKFNNRTVSTPWTSEAPGGFRFGGGGGPSGQQGVAATPITAASPPVTATNAEVVQSQQDLRRQALKKRGFTSTIHAGDTGGWFDRGAVPSPGNPKVTGGYQTPGPRTLGG